MILLLFDVKLNSIILLPFFDYRCNNFFPSVVTELHCSSKLLVAL